MTLKQIRRASRAMYRRSETYCTECGQVLLWDTSTGAYESAGSRNCLAYNYPSQHKLANGKRVHRFSNGNQLTVR